MKKVRLVETFDDNSSTPSIALTENRDNSNPKSSIVDGKYIIGMIEGQFFKPDGKSRNERWYPRSLWVKTLAKADTKNRLANRTMFGEIGHSEGPVEDMTLRQGCASHFIDDLWIDEQGRGMGRAYILGTPTGHLLKVYLGAGCKLKTSTRGEGNYKDGVFHDGCPVVDDDTYDFQTVDFVLNPGFLETSAVLKESYNLSKNIDQKQVQETLAYVKKEGEKRMTLDIDAYVADLKQDLKEAKAENKSLNEQLQVKNNELLQSKLNSDNTIKKLNEELTPFKNLKVSAKSITENFKKLQNDLKKCNADKDKLTEELNQFKSYCGSVKELELAVKLSAKSLKMIEEYRKIGTPNQFKEALENAKVCDEKLKKLNEDTNCDKLQQDKKLEETLSKSAQYIKSLKERLSKEQVSRKELTEAKRAVERAKDTIAELTETANLSSKLLEQYKELKRSHESRSKRLKETVEKTSRLVEKYEALKQDLEAKDKELAESKKAIVEATSLITSLKQTAKLAESLSKKYKELKEQNSTSVNEDMQESKQSIKQNAIKLSEKYGCSIETAAKLITKRGLHQASCLLETAINNIKNRQTDKKGLSESTQLVEEVAQLDKVTSIQPEKSAKDFLKDGIIKNYFNHDALGKEVVYGDLNKLDGTKNAGTDKAKELLKNYKDKFEVEKVSVNLDKENTPAQAEQEAKKLLK